MAEPISALPPTTAADLQEHALPLGTSGGVRTVSKPVSGDLYARMRGRMEYSFDRVRRSGSRLLWRAKGNASHLATEHPMKVVAGVAVAAFLTGVALRIWRGDHD